MELCRCWLSAAAVVVALVAGCASTSIGVPPSDHDLVNDGSLEAQSDLHRRYSLYYANNVVYRPGASIAEVQRELKKHIDDTRADASDDEVRSYVAASPEASALLDGPLPLADRWNAQLGAGVATVVTAVITFVGFVFVMPALTGTSLSSGGSGGTPGAAPPVTSTDIGIGIVIAVEFSPIGYALSALVGEPVTHILAGDSYRDACDAWNRDLDARIAKAARLAPPQAEPVPRAAPPSVDPADDALNPDAP